MIEATQPAENSDHTRMPFLLKEQRPLFAHAVFLAIYAEKYHTILDEMADRGSSREARELNRQIKEGLSTVSDILRHHISEWSAGIVLDDGRDRNYLSYALKAFTPQTANEEYIDDTTTVLLHRQMLLRMSARANLLTADIIHSKYIENLGYLRHFNSYFLNFAKKVTALAACVDETTFIYSEKIDSADITESDQVGSLVRTIATIDLC